MTLRSSGVIPRNKFYSPLLNRNWAFGKGSHWKFAVDGLFSSQVFGVYSVILSSNTVNGPYLLSQLVCMFVFRKFIVDHIPLDVC